VSRLQYAESRTFQRRNAVLRKCSVPGGRTDVVSHVGAREARVIEVLSLALSADITPCTDDRTSLGSLLEQREGVVDAVELERPADHHVEPERPREDEVNQPREVARWDARAVPAPDDPALLQGDREGIDRRTSVRRRHADQHRGPTRPGDARGELDRLGPAQGLERDVRTGGQDGPDRRPGIVAAEHHLRGAELVRSQALSALYEAAAGVRFRLPKGSSG